MKTLCNSESSNAISFHYLSIFILFHITTHSSFRFSFKISHMPLSSTLMRFPALDAPPPPCIIQPHTVFFGLYTPSFLSICRQHLCGAHVLVSTKGPVSIIFLQVVLNILLSVFHRRGVPVELLCRVLVIVLIETTDQVQSFTRVLAVILSLVVFP